EQLALTLYRDPGLVRVLLAQIDFDEGVERAALALDDGGDGPFVIVTKEGRFVTCLARGMRPDPTQPVISRAKLDGIRGDFGAFREKFRTAEALDPGRRSSLLGRLST